MAVFASLARVRPRVVSGNFMNKPNESHMDDELRAEYDLSTLKGRVRGKYAERYREGTNVVVLAPDVAAAFPNDEAVNEALRLLINIAKTTGGKAA